MEHLPLEALASICSHLDRRSLTNFSLSDKRSRDACKTFLFQHIRVNATDGGDLQAKCERWSSFLQVVNSTQHVRCLDVSAKLQPTDPPPRRDAGDNPRPYHHKLYRLDGMLADKHCDPEFRSVLTPVEVQAIVFLVGILRGLKHLTWDCPWQPIPPPVLEVLTRIDCRLSLPSFRLHSLLRRSTQNVEIDACDLQLATSPCLESVTLRYEVKEDVFENYNYDALLDMIAGAAPNLHNVTLEQGLRCYGTQGHGLTDPNPPHPRGPRKPWQEDLIPNQRSRSLGTLRSLNFQRSMSANDLLVLSTKTDLSILCSLRIAAGVEVLAWLTDRLTSLHTLDINLTDRDGNNSNLLQAAAETFFFSLAPLSCVTLRGTWTSPTLEIVLGRHGVTLQKLFCPDYTSPITAQMVQRFCPVLQELSMPLQRTQGDALEASIYETLGQLPIRSATLSLRQTDPAHTREHFGEYLYQPSRRLFEKFTEAELQKLLVNCAVDEAFARAVFGRVASGKENLGLPHLEALNLVTENISPLFASHGYPQALMLPIAHLNRSWLAVRNPRDDRGANDCLVERLPVAKLSWHENVLREFTEKGLDYNALDPSVEMIMRSIWPESGPWQDVCHSLPLASD